MSPVVANAETQARSGSPASTAAARGRKSGPEHRSGRHQQHELVGGMRKPFGPRHPLTPPVVHPSVATIASARVPELRPRRGSCPMAPRRAPSPPPGRSAFKRHQSRVVGRRLPPSHAMSAFTPGWSVCGAGPGGRSARALEQPPGRPGAGVLLRRVSSNAARGSPSLSISMSLSRAPAPRAASPRGSQPAPDRASQPDSPCRTTSTMPPAGVAITGRLQARASRTT